MQKSYLSKTTISYPDFKFYIRPGDLLLYDSAQHRLTVYRNGQIVKVVKQDPLGISAFLKNKFIEEPPTVPTEPLPPVEEPIHTELRHTESRKSFSKRDKPVEEVKDEEQCFD